MCINKWEGNADAHIFQPGCDFYVAACVEGCEEMKGMQRLRCAFSVA